MTHKIIAVVTAGVFLAACSNGMSRRAPIQMNPAPTAPVSSEQLAPPPGTQSGPDQQYGNYQGQQGGQFGNAPAQQPSAVATTAAPPKKEDVLGQWTIADSSSSCQLNVSLTGWSGGYRASTRNCSSEELKRVGAWNIVGNTVVLKDKDGQQVAVLARSSERRFDGSLAIGGAVAMLR